MSEQKLIVISFDALVYDDISYLKNKPNFSMMLKNGSMVKRIDSIYPTITYPCHTTMITGCWPDKHGVIHNCFDIPGKFPWKFGHEHVECEDLINVCKKAGLKTASVGWPVSGNHPDVDYLVDECWPDKGAPVEEYRKTYIEYGTPKWLFDEVVEPFLELRIGKKQPESSYFLANICAEIIKKYQPDVLVVHPAVVDTFRHKTGVFSDLVTEGLDHCDKILGMIIQATKDAGVFEKTNFVVTSDHGQLDATRTVHLNCYLAQEGLIETDENNNITNRKVWCFSTGMSAYVKLSSPEDSTLYNNTYTLLKQKCADESWGVSRVYTKEECKKMHIDLKEYSFMLETDGHTSFGNEWHGDAVRQVEPTPYGNVNGNHGFHPDKGPKPTFIACGPAIKKGAVIESAHLIDGAPTYAKILGLSMPYADGKPIDALLNDYK